MITTYPSMFTTEHNLHLALVLDHGPEDVDAVQYDRHVNRRVAVIVEERGIGAPKLDQIVQSVHRVAHHRMVQGSVTVHVLGVDVLKWQKKH